MEKQMEWQGETESTTQKLQNKVDKLKLLNLTSNIHNLTPPQKQDDDATREIALVAALSVTPRIQEKFLEIRGLELDPHQKKFIQVTTPIMNILGAYRFCKLLKTIAQEVEWASYAEEEIPPRTTHFFEENIGYFLFYNDRYELHPADFNYVITILQIFIDAPFHKSKQGKYINTLGRTYAEDVLKKALDTQGDQNKKEQGFLEKYNPFKNK